MHAPTSAKAGQTWSDSPVVEVVQVHYAFSVLNEQHVLINLDAQLRRQVEEGERLFRRRVRGQRCDGGVHRWQWGMWVLYSIRR